MEYTNVFPDDFKSRFFKMAKAYNCEEFVDSMKRCRIEHINLGYAHYNGIHNLWNFEALKVFVYGPGGDLNLFKSKNNYLQMSLMMH